MIEEKFKIDEDVIKTSNLIKKYSRFFEECTEDKNYLRIRKDFPFTELEEEELRFIIFTMISVHCDEETEG